MHLFPLIDADQNVFTGFAVYERAFDLSIKNYFIKIREFLLLSLMKSVIGEGRCGRWG